MAALPAAAPAAASGLFDSVSRMPPGALIGFGSCARQNRPQPFWPTVRAPPGGRLGAWFWTGDIVYPLCPAIACVREAYAALAHNPHYRRFAGDPALFLDGVWDDHDYGVNDGGGDFEFRDDSQQLLLAFLAANATASGARESDPPGGALGLEGILDRGNAAGGDAAGDAAAGAAAGGAGAGSAFLHAGLPRASLQARLARDGVYSSHLLEIRSAQDHGLAQAGDFGRAGSGGSFADGNFGAVGDGAHAGAAATAGGLSHTAAAPTGHVKVILLDTRKHRDSPFLGGVRLPSKATAALRLLTAFLGLGAGHSGDMLGAAQWAWLDAQLAAAAPDGKPILATVLVSSVQVLTAVPIFESWGHYPHARARLFDLLARHAPPGLMLVSGDVHMGEVLGDADCVVEFTASGMTHSIADHSALFLQPFKKLVYPFFQTKFRNANEGEGGGDFSEAKFQNSGGDAASSEEGGAPGGAESTARERETAGAPAPASATRVYIGRNFLTLRFDPYPGGLAVTGDIRDIHDGLPRVSVAQRFDRNAPRDLRCLRHTPSPIRAKRAVHAVLIVAAPLALAALLVHRVLRPLLRRAALAATRYRRLPTGAEVEMATAAEASAGAASGPGVRQRPVG